jgi:hypothetical protein
MTPKLSSELEECVTATPEGAVMVEGVDGATYWLMTEEALRIREYVQVGIDQANRGEVAPWNTQGIIDRAQQLHEQSSSSCSE